MKLELVILRMTKIIFKKKVNKINNKIFKGGTRLDYGVTYEKETSSNEPQLKNSQ